MRILAVACALTTLIGCKSQPDRVAPLTTTEVETSASASETLVTIHGKLLKKEWSKSTQSYCAQGSEYYVVRTADEAIVLEPDKTPKASMLDKNVVVKGFMRTKTIKHDTEGQHPVGDSYTCRVLVVRSVELIE